nr:restriction endonuclease [Rhodococcus qingshengii]
MFLADAVAGYIETLNERDFDAPFIALLYSQGFTNVHLTHGPLEFGKDFIARRTEQGIETQYVFQSKAGKISLSEWREVRGQIDSMRYGNVVHPDFDPDLSRRLVLVTTGRLTGTALVEFQEYNQHCEARGHEAAELWDIDVLLPQLTEVLIAGVPVHQRARTVELWGRLGSGEGTWAEIRAYSRDWFKPGLSTRERWEQTLTGAMLTKAAQKAGREDLAACLALLLIRREWENPPEGGTQANGSPLRAARRLFLATALEFWETARAEESNYEAIDLIVTHPVRTARANEILSLLGIYLLNYSEESENPDKVVAEIAQHIDSAFKKDEAAAHLVSDDYAISLLVTCTFLAACGHDAAIPPILRAAAVWIFDRADEGHGIAPVGSSASEVVNRLLGTPYEHVKSAGNGRSSYAITVIADLSLLLGHQELYADVCNDIWALDLIPQLVLPTEVEQADLIARVEYSRDGSTAPEHHSASAKHLPSYSDGALFDCIAGWTTLRDRHHPVVIAAVTS